MLSPLILILITTITISLLIIKLTNAQKKATQKSLVSNYIRHKPRHTITNSFTFKKKLLIICNPHSGSNKTVFMLNEIVLPLAELYQMESIVYLTEYEGHVIDVILQEDLKGFDGVLCIGGDGTVEEVFSGVYLREDIQDFDAFFKGFFVGVMPGGTGNGVACTVSCNDWFEAAVSFFEGVPHPIDVMKIEYMEEGEVRKTVHSIMSWETAFVAQVNELVEKKWRAIPGTTFRGLLVAAVVMLLNKHLRGRISFKPVENEDKIDPVYNRSNEFPLSDVYPGFREVDSNFNLIEAMNVTHLAHDMHFAPLAVIDEGSVDLLWADNMTRLSNIKLFLKVDKQEHLDDSVLSLVKTSEFWFDTEASHGWYSSGGQLEDFCSQVHVTVLPSQASIVFKEK